MTEAVPSMRFAQKSVLITGAAAGKGASRMGGEADEPVRPATGSRGGDAPSLQRGRVAMTGQATNVTGGFIMT
jgi:hypothetical protein